jgi:hypothetical protein
MGCFSLLVIETGYSIFAHSRPDKIGAPRLLPLYYLNIFFGLSAKKSVQILYPVSSKCMLGA